MTPRHESVIAKVKIASEDALRKTTVHLISLLSDLSNKDAVLRDDLNSIILSVDESLDSQPNLPKKVAPPPPRKAPPALTLATSKPKGKAISAKWVQLHWPPAAGSPVREHSGRLMGLSDFFERALDALHVQQHNVPVASRTIFDIPRKSQVGMRVCEDALFIEEFGKTKKNLKPIDEPKEVFEKFPGGRAHAFDRSTCQKLGITIKRFLKSRGSLEKFRNAIVTCTLTPEEIHLLMDTFPDPTNRSSAHKTKEWEDLVQKASRVEEMHGTSLFEEELYVLMLSRIPSLHQRLQCLYIAHSFADLTSAILKKVDHMERACIALLHSSSLATIFQAILDVGNYLNEGTTQGNRKWFRLDVLTQILQFRGNITGPTALIDILARHVGPGLPDDVFEMLSKAKDASLLQVMDLTGNVVEVYLMAVKGDIMAEIPRVDEEDRFPEIMDELSYAGIDAVRTLVSRVEGFLTIYAELAVFLGDPEVILPIDKRIMDEKSGQMTNTPDLFSRLWEFFALLRSRCKALGIKKCICDDDGVRPPKTMSPSLEDTSENVSSIPNVAALTNDNTVGVHNTGTELPKKTLPRQPNGVSSLFKSNRSKLLQTSKKCPMIHSGLPAEYNNGENRPESIENAKQNCKSSPIRKQDKILGHPSRLFKSKANLQRLRAQMATLSSSSPEIKAPAGPPGKRRNRSSINAVYEFGRNQETQS